MNPFRAQVLKKNTYNQISHIRAGGKATGEDKVVREGKQERKVSFRVGGRGGKGHVASGKV